MLELVKSNEVENKPKNVENSEYKYSKEEICSICNVGQAAFERFVPLVVRERDFISAGLIYIGYSIE